MGFTAREYAISNVTGKGSTMGLSWRSGHRGNRFQYTMRRPSSWECCGPVLGSTLLPYLTCQRHMPLRGSSATERAPRRVTDDCPHPLSLCAHASSSGRRHRFTCRSTWFSAKRDPKRLRASGGVNIAGIAIIIIQANHSVRSQLDREVSQWRVRTLQGYGRTALLLPHVHCY